jgi:hypothetical protein
VDAIRVNYTQLLAPAEGSCLWSFPADCRGSSEGGTGFKRRWCVGWASLGLLPTENRPADSAGAHSRRNFSIVCTRQMLISHRRDAEMVLIYIISYLHAYEGAIMSRSKGHK